MSTTAGSAVVCREVSKTFYERDETLAYLPEYRGLVGRWRYLRTRPTPVRAVDRVSFEIRRGEIFGVLGPNGSGKSTLVRLIATLLLPDAGSVTVFGHDVVKERLAVRRLINRVSVEASFFKKLSALENLRYAARLYGYPPREGTEKALDILERLGFNRRKAFGSLENLSRGMQQKVAVARALFTSPVLLLLDEPTTGLDPRSKREVQDFILEVRETHDTTVLLTSHDMSEADRLCDRVAFIDEGRFVAEGTPSELKETYGRPGGDGTVSLEDVFLEVTGKEWPGEEDV
ncbi:MAG TPA: ABC transporter ATP-binding protein [Clostridiales bacterium]|nr:ABC transporter ATP-binding protein [Clostridiales bacterium]